MRTTTLLLSVLTVSACANGTEAIPMEEPTSSSPSIVSSASSTEAATKPLEQVPSELSLAHFSTMRLEGTEFTLGNVLADNAAYTRYTITYKSNGLLVSGIMNIPKGEGPFPLVLLNHGYIATSVYTNGRGLKREQDYLARQGFAVLHSDYRGHAFSDPSPDEREVYDAGIEYSMDVINAIQALRAANIPKVDATRVGMLGHSMGGGVTLNVISAYPNMVDAAVLYAPVHSDAWENFLRWRNDREEGDRTVEVMGTREEHPENWDALSSLPLLQNIQVPVLLFHGTNDKDVPKSWSDFLNAKLKELGKNITYVEYQGEGHEYGPKWGDFMAKTAEFFKTNL